MFLSGVVHIWCLCFFFSLSAFYFIRSLLYVCYVYPSTPSLYVSNQNKKDDNACVSLMYAHMHICFHVVCFYISTARSYMPPQRPYYDILRVFFRKFLICNTLGFYVSRRYVIYYSNI